MKMPSRFFFLKQPVDLRIIQFAGAEEDGYCRIVGDDYYEAEEEYDNEEVKQFKSRHKALEWLEENRYAPLDPAQEDGVFRWLEAAELFARYFDIKPVVHIKMPRTAPLTPVERAVIDMISA